MASIQVFVRIRPMLQKEIDAREEVENRFKCQNNRQQIIVDIPQKNRQKVFNFNQVFHSQAGQAAVHHDIGLNQMVERVLDGYHSTIFAYGQTGSGKTYTIEGPADDPGLVPKVLQDMFCKLQQINNIERSYKVMMSFVQIYNEGIYDLIDCSGVPLKMRWNKYQQFLVENLFQVQCRSRQEATKWWSKGQKNKIMGAHNMNATSSRSHCLLTLKVVSYSLEDPSDQIQSKFEIVDLAGSQRQKVTKSEGIIFKEAIEINKSLFSLRQVISSLYEISQGQNSNKHVPYRDSKLTSLLKQSIGGNTYCVMIACLNPTSTHFQESIQTLTYASMASYICNKPTKNTDPKMRENQQLRQQNQQYEKQIKKMSEHIEELTELLKSQICIRCQNSDEPVKRSDEQSEPTGIKLPRFNSKTEQSEKYWKSHAKIRSTLENNDNEKESIVEGSKSIMRQQPPVVKRKTLKTTQQVLDSIIMIKQLINANGGLRQKIEKLKKMYEGQEKQIYSLNQENQVLRNRWDMMNEAIGQQCLTSNQGIGRKPVEAPITVYEKLLQGERGFTGSSFSKNPDALSRKTKTNSYNEFLKLSAQKNPKAARSSKKKTLASLREPSSQSRVNRSHIDQPFT